MSYCRFSTNDFQCDLYCYESKSGYETHIAQNRFVFREPMPPPVEFSLDTSDQWFARHQAVMREVDRADKVKIGLPHDGESFTDTSLEDFLTRLIHLKDVGYQFPDDVIETVKEEMENEKIA